jgi:uncharacterized protein YbjQ (UPF0145 family)
MKRIGAVLVTGLLMLGGGPALGVETGAVKVYDATQIAPSRYTVVKRLWTESARSMFWIPSDDNERTAVASLTDEAARLGADGVVNLHCAYDGGVYCYGLAIKLKP